jgi:hypothetical protein
MTFLPDLLWIEQCVARGEVKSYIIGNRFREKVYMVTGIMVASSSRSFRSSLEERRLYIHAGIDLSAWTGVPVALGPEVEWTKKESTTESGEREGDFVFAFRVREIRVKRKGGVKTHKIYDKGALFSTEKKAEKNMTNEDELEVEGLSEEADGEEFGLEVKDAMQAADNAELESEECSVVLPEEYSM